MSNEKWNTYMRKYYQANKTKCNSLTRRWAQNNPEKMKEIITRHRRKKGIMPRTKKTKDEHRLARNAETQQRRLRIMAGLDELIQQIHCVDCDLSFAKFPWLAKFHHEDDRSGVGRGIKSYASSITRLFTELNKGVYLCPNCHDTRHFVEDMTGIIGVNS